MSANNWIVEVHEDPSTGELILPIPTDLLSQMGWDEGTDLWWTVEDGKVVLKENENGISKTE